MNKVFLIGRLTRDPRHEHLTLGTQEVSVTNFAIAVNESNERTTYFRIVAWRGLADICAKYLSKGRQVCVEGSVHQKTYVGTDNKEHPYMEVLASNVTFLGANPANHQNDVQNAPATDTTTPETNYDAPQTSSTENTEDDNDLPF